MVEAEEAEAVEAVEGEEVEVVEEEVVEEEAEEEDLPPHSHHNSRNNSKMLPQPQMSKRWESSQTHSMATEQKQKTSLKKLKDTFA